MTVGTVGVQSDVGNLKALVSWTLEETLTEDALKSTRAQHF